MDFAEREQQKKRRLIRVILGEVAMVLAVIFIVTITLLITMGFFVTSDGRIEQTGLIQIHSIPTGASVTIDGTTIFSRTNLSRSLAAGEHHLKLSRDNYDTWEKTIKMYSGLLMRLYYPRLFLLNRTPETMLNLDDNLEFYSASSERNFLLYAGQDSPLWQLVNVASDDLKTTTLDLATILPGVEQGIFRGAVAELTWSAGGDTVLTAIDYQDRREWLLINLKDPTTSLNLTRTFGFDFDQVELVNGTTNQLFVLENHQLRRIDVASRQISGVLLNQIETFSSQGSNLLYLTTPKTTEDQTTRIIGTYRDGERGGTTLTTVTDDTNVLIALSRYYDNDYLAYIIGDQLTVYYGSLPSYSEQPTDPLANLEPLIESAQLTEAPTAFLVSPGGEYLVAQRDQAVTVIDLYMGDLYAYDLPEATLAWLDDSLLYSIENGDFNVWDFDGTNRRQLVTDHATEPGAANLAADTNSDADDTASDDDGLKPVTTLSASPLADYPAMITSNNKWLYYLTRTDDGYTLVREQIWD